MTKKSILSKLASFYFNILNHVDDGLLKHRFSFICNHLYLIWSKYEFPVRIDGKRIHDKLDWKKSNKHMEQWMLLKQLMGQKCENVQVDPVKGSNKILIHFTNYVLFIEPDFFVSKCIPYEEFKKDEYQ